MSRALVAVALAALALSACGQNTHPSPSASAVPHGSSSSVNCPEQDPAQPNCKVPTYASIDGLIVGEQLVPR